MNWPRFGVGELVDYDQRRGGQVRTWRGVVVEVHPRHCRVFVYGWNKAVRINHANLRPVDPDEAMASGPPATGAPPITHSQPLAPDEPPPAEPEGSVKGGAGRSLRRPAPGATTGATHPLQNLEASIFRFSGCVRRPTTKSRSPGGDHHQRANEKSRPAGELGSAESDRPVSSWPSCEWMHDSSSGSEDEQGPVGQRTEWSRNDE